MDAQVQPKLQGIPLKYMDAQVQPKLQGIPLKYMDAQVQPKLQGIPLPTDEFFVPDGYGIFKIKQTKLNNLPIPARTLLYPNLTSTVGDLVNIFIDQYSIKPNTFGAGFKVRFGLHTVGILPNDLQVFELKSKLNNMRIKVLEFIPCLSYEDNGSRGNFNQQCNPIKQLSFKDHELYRYFESKDNVIEVCVEFPQFHHIYYSEMMAGNTLQEQIIKLLQLKIKQIGKDLSKMTFKAKCKGCGQPAQISKKVCLLFQSHFGIQIRFDKLEQSPKRNYLTKVVIEIVEGSNHIIVAIPYQDISKKKVKTVLQEWKVPNAPKLGLRIQGTSLRPIDFFQKVQSQVGILTQGTVQAFIIQQSQIFYGIGPMFKKSAFDLNEVAATFEGNIGQYKRRLVSKIIQSRDQRLNKGSTQHKDKDFLDPLLGYTSQIYYNELNSCLRDTDFGEVAEEDYYRIQYKFSFAILKSLMRLPIYGGATYRGVGFKDKQAKIGSIVCFKSFTSSSMSISAAQKFGKATFYTIHSLTGRNISQYSIFPTEAQVLFMPYTYFQVTNVQTETTGWIKVTMQQIPIPRHSGNTNLLFWVDDNPKDGSEIYKELYNAYPRLTTQIIQLTSNDNLKIWYKKFGHYTKTKAKTTLITDLKRGDNLEDGIQTIKLMRDYMGNDLDIFIYVYNIQPAKELLLNKGLNLSSKLSIGKAKKEAIQFITQKAVEKSELEADKCQLI